MTQPLRTRRDYGSDQTAADTASSGVSAMIDAAEFERTLKQSMHETGVSVDPTKDMSPEDAAEWKRQNEKHKDNFKSSSDKVSEVFSDGTKVTVRNKGKKTEGKVVRFEKGSLHGGSPFYVVDVGEYESLKVPAHEVQKSASNTHKVAEAALGSMFRELEAFTDKVSWDLSAGLARFGMNLPYRLPFGRKSPQREGELPFLSGTFAITGFPPGDKDQAAIARKVVTAVAKKFSNPEYTFTLEGRPDWTNNEPECPCLEFQYMVHFTKSRSASLTVKTADSGYVESSLMKCSDYEAELDKESKFEKGKSMTPEQVSKVVGPEFAENVENPPEAVKKLQKEMESKSAATDKEAKILARQVKILKDYVEGAGTGAATDYDDLPQEVQSALVRVKDSEVLWSDVNRWLSDNTKRAGMPTRPSGPAKGQGRIYEGLKKGDIIYWNNHEFVIDKANEDGSEVFFSQKGTGHGQVRTNLRGDPAYQGIKSASMETAPESDKTAAKRVHFKPGDKLVVKPVPPGLQKSYPASKWMTAQVEVEAIDEGASDGLDVYDVKTPGGEEESIYGFQVVKKVASSESDKTAASGLYGFTKEAEKVCGSAANKLAKFATKLAKDIYEKDSGTPAFLEEHTARTASKAASMLRGCMAEIGPGQPAKTAAKGEKGRYGFSAKTARLALEACNAVEHEAGVIASDLDARMGTKYAAITGFLNKHAKRAKCGWSDLILEAYPAQSEQIIASEAVEKTASDLSGYEVHPSVAEILTWDGQGTPREAASFLASEDDDILAGRTWDGDKSTPDDATPYNIHPKSPPAGADGSEQRWKYNQWFRQNVCPGHKTNCGL